jgi:uncharacterized protein (TIGR03118 family)
MGHKVQHLQAKGVSMQKFRTLMLGLASLSAAAAADSYIQHNLVSDQLGVADHRDQNLVNAWGLDHSPAGPWWVNANGTGLSQVYNGAGQPFPLLNPLSVTIPDPGGGTSTPTGIVFNGSQSFQIAPGQPALFIMVTEGGTIAAWNPSVNGGMPVIAFDSKGGAVYKGVALGKLHESNVLFAANFRTGLVDMFNDEFTPVTLSMSAFHDPDIPAGYAPFNVQNVGGNIAVAFAEQDDAHHDEVAGEGKGYVDIFTPAGVLLMQFQHGRWMNAPWAITLAPPDFGTLGKKYLVGNFGNGRIAAFNEDGQFDGLMTGPDGKWIFIEGLWGLGFGNGGNAGAANVLFFAAGPTDENHGLFGTLTLVTADNNGNDNNGKDDNGQGDDKGNGQGNDQGNGQGNGQGNDQGNNNGNDQGNRDNRD